MNPESKHTKSRFISRRDFWFEAGMGVGGIALIDLLTKDKLMAAEVTGTQTCSGSAGVTQSPFLPKPPHFKPRAKSMISLFMSGGLSHVDSFDYKPDLAKYHGMLLEGKGEVIVRQGYPGPLMKSPYNFKQYGKSGMWVSDLFPNIGSIVDELSFIHSCKGKSADHILSHFEWHTGSIVMGFPSVGSWVTYGLGSENQTLPAYVVIYDKSGGPYAGAPNWGSGFLPAAYQGTVFRAEGDPILDLQPPAEYVNAKQQRARLDQLNWVNERHAEKFPGSTDLSARIASYELAYRMQGCAPAAVDISGESEETQRLYGLNDPVTSGFGKQCLLARRLVERGVRYIQLFGGSSGNSNSWDAHDSIVDNHGKRAAEVDKPVAGLITDLKRRGLLDETLVVFHSEFGRMPISQKGVGRDHNPGTMTMFMAGAGIPGGQRIGASDEIGYKAVDQVVTNNDVHATMLHMLGMDHKRLTYYFNGRNMRLTDVAGIPIPQITGKAGPV